MKRNIKSTHGVALILGVVALALFGIVQTAAAHSDSHESAKTAPIAHADDERSLFEAALDRVKRFGGSDADRERVREHMDEEMEEKEEFMEQKSRERMRFEAEDGDMRVRSEVRTEVRSDDGTATTASTRSHSEARLRAMSGHEALERARAKFTDRVEEREARQADIAEKREELRERREEHLREMQERREEIQERINDRMKERAEAFLSRVLDRFAAALDRLRGLADRMESRIEKLEDIHGIELTAAREELAEARAEIDNAEDNLTVVAEEAGSVLEDAEDPRAAFLAVKDLLGEAKTELRNAHRALVEALREIKVALGLRTDDDSATTTDAEEEDEDEDEDDDDTDDDTATTTQ